MAYTKRRWPYVYCKNLCFVRKKTNQNVTGFPEVFQFLNIVLRSHLIKRTLWGETWSMIEVIKGGLLWCPRATLGDIEQGGVHKLRWPNFATSWPPIISDLPLVDISEWISFNVIRKDLCTVSRTTYPLSLVHVVIEWPLGSPSQRMKKEEKQKTGSNQAKPTDFSLVCK